MTGILTAIAFLIIFSLLVLVHELGHFYAARKAKIKVEEFGFGLPPRAKKLWKDKEGTIFSINWIPFGGFVKMLGEDATDEKILKDPNSFASKTVWQRLRVIVAGVTMNFAMAIILLTFAYIVGMKPFLVTEEDFKYHYQAGNILAETEVVVSQVIKNSPAELAGIQKDDIILEVNEQKIIFADDVISAQANQELSSYLILRNGNQILFEMKPNADGKMGIGLNYNKFDLEVKKITYPFYLAPWEALKTTFEYGKLTVVMFGQLLVNLTQFIMPKDVAGPVGIVQMTHKIVQLGEFMELVKFTALLSISLAVINILPFPALDGGRLVFLVYEGITRRKPSANAEAMIHGIGYLFLMGLILIITWNDLDRILHFSDLWSKFINLF